MIFLSIPLLPLQIHGVAAKAAPSCACELQPDLADDMERVVLHTIGCDTTSAEVVDFVWHSDVATPCKFRPNKQTNKQQKDRANVEELKLKSLLHLLLLLFLSCHGRSGWRSSCRLAEAPVARGGQPRPRGLPERREGRGA
jgi:hypothetical protein